MKFRKHIVQIVVVLSLISPGLSAAVIPEIRGWNILSGDEAQALKTIEAAKASDVNQLQLSHHIIHDLKEIRDLPKQRLVKTLTAAAHDAGIDEVLLWDHALYGLEYYPKEYLVDGKLDLDSEAFWNWFKADYRSMLDLSGDIDGIVLTFIETGANVENSDRVQSHKAPAVKYFECIDSSRNVSVY